MKLKKLPTSPFSSCKHWTVFKIYFTPQTHTHTGFMDYCSLSGVWWMWWTAPTSFFQPCVMVYNLTVWGCVKVVGHAEGRSLPGHGQWFIMVRQLVTASHRTAPRTESFIREVGIEGRTKSCFAEAVYVRFGWWLMLTPPKCYSKYGEGKRNY